MNLITGLYNYIFYQPIFNILMGIYAPLQHLPMAFGFSIILMTIFIRSLLVPVFVRQLKSSKAMQEIGPQVQEIQRVYRQEPAVMQRELSALYKAHGVNPYMGCLPLLIQLPFLWSVYGSLNAILAYINAKGSGSAQANIHQHLYPFTQAFLGSDGLKTLLNPSNISFLGINLAHPDPHYILPVLAAVLTFAQTRMTLGKKPQSKPGQAPDPNAASMQLMQYIFPVMTLIFGLRFPAGLALYWVITTSFTIAQQYFVNGRSWGGLLRGIPGLDPELKAAGLGTSALALTDAPRRGSRMVDAAPVAPKAIAARSETASRREAPTAKNGNLAKSAFASKETNALAFAEDTDGFEDTDGEEAVKLSKPASPRPTTNRTSVKSGATKPGAVKLVTANGNGSVNGTVVVPRMAKPAVAGAARPAMVGAKPRPATNGARPTPKPTTSSRPRKGAR